MPDKKEKTTPLYYWDADVFLSYVNKRDDRTPDISALLAEAQQGKVSIITSVITIAEVAWGATEQLGHPLDPKVEDQINALWTPPSPVGLISYYQQIGDKAKDIMREGRENGWNLKPMDAIHMATAHRRKVDALHTYNAKDFDKFSGILGIAIERPKPLQPSLLE